MALTDEGNGNGFYMPVAPAYGGGYGGQGGFGSFGGDWGWIILLLLIAGNGGWGMGAGGFGGYGNMQLGMDFPWLLNGQNGINNNVSSGFRDVQLNDGITSIRDGIGNLSTQLCNCCGDMQMAVSNGFASAEQSANARQMANMNQAFNAQTAMMQGFNNVQSQFADCCCENRLANCQTQNIIQNEGSSTRFADLNNTRDIIESQTRGTQAILDKLCALELDGVKGQLAQAQRENLALQNQVNMGAFRESQTAQNAFIQQGFANEVDALYNRLNSCPVPTTPVYSRTPIFTCNNNGCGCGCNG